MNINPLHATDFYKIGHIKQAPPGTTLVYANFTPRSDKLSPIPPWLSDGKVVVFGIRAFVQDFLVDTWNKEFFLKPKQAVVAAYARRMRTSLGNAAADTSHIEALHDLGYLPLAIKAIAEGSCVPIRTPVLVLHNTHKDFAWLPGFIEPALSAYLWKTMTTATIARAYRRLLTAYAHRTGTALDFVKYQGHDFSLRGMSGLVDGALSGMGHLTAFSGTDSIPAIDAVEQFYDVAYNNTPIGVSVPATEHSVMCMGMPHNELDTFRRLITETYPEGVVSIVSDTWDFWKVVTHFVSALKPEIMARDGKVVIRPDSGDPVDIICGTAIPLASIRKVIGGDARPNRSDAYNCQRDMLGLPVVEHGGRYYQLASEFDARWKLPAIYPPKPDAAWADTGIPWNEITPPPAMKGAVRCLWEVFGGTRTTTGHKLLDSHIGLIYGDSITLARCAAILQRLDQMGYASGNCVFGIGSFTYQHVTRDSFGFAMKATYAVVDSVARELFKDPITDSGTKKSLKGLVKVTMTDGVFITHDQCRDFDEPDCVMQNVFVDNGVPNAPKFSDIRRRILEQSPQLTISDTQLPDTE